MVSTPKDSDDKIIVDFEDAFEENSIYKEIKSIDFSKGYNLVSILQLNDSVKYRESYKTLVEMNISNNSLTVLRLKGFNYLTTITATSNLINVVELNLINLKHLNLSKNSLTSLFEMISLPELTTLDLSKNSIFNCSYEYLKPVKATLTTLDLSHNQIRFETGANFLEFFEIVGQNMKCMTVLNVKANLFTKVKGYKDYLHYIINKCRHLELLNNRKIEQTDRETARNVSSIEHAIKSSSGEPNTIRGMESEKGTVFVTLEQINKKIEELAFKKFSHKNFKEIEQLIDNYISYGAKTASQEDNIDDNELDQFENFLENVSLISDSHQNMERLMFGLIGRLLTTKNGKFSERACNYLKQNSNPEKAPVILDVLQNFPLRYLMNVDMMFVPPPVIFGLKIFIHEINYQNSMQRLTPRLLTCMEKVDIVILLESIENADINRQQGILQAAYSFLSECSQNEFYLFYLTKNSKFLKKFSADLNFLLMKRNSENEQNFLNYPIVLDKMLVMMENIASYLDPEDEKKNSQVSKILFGSGLTDRLEQSLVDEYNTSIIEEESNDKYKKKSRDLIKLQKAILMNMMKCYGALLFRTDKKSYLNIQKNNMIQRILNIQVKNDNQDPFLVAGSAAFISYLLNNKIVCSTFSTFSFITKKLYYLKDLLPTIDIQSAKYLSAAKSAEDYGDNVIEKGQPIDFKTLDSPLINEMLFQVLGVIMNFGKISVTSKDEQIKNQCKNVLQDLDNQNRDEIICSVLNILSDKLKKRAVQTLYYMDVTQLDVNELGMIYKQVNNINLLGGASEEAISYIYVILTRCFESAMLEGKPEVVEQNKESISLAFNVLLKNQSRDSSKMSQFERDSKNFLSCTICNFINTLSAFPSLSKYFDTGSCLSYVPKILYYEEKYMVNQQVIPIQIEKSRGGWKISSLDSCFKGNNQLNPYTYTFLRVLIHMADMLAGAEFHYFEYDGTVDYRSNILNLRKSLVQDEISYVTREKETLNNIYAQIYEKNASLPEKTKFTCSESYMSEQHKEFLLAFQSVFLFIQGKTKNNEIVEYSQIWEDKFDKKLAEIEDYRAEEEENIEYTEENAAKEEAEGTVKEKLLTFLRKEEYKLNEGAESLKKEYDYINADTVGYKLYGTSEENLVRFPHEETGNNPYIRTLVCSAFLRCIHAVLKYKGEGSQRQQMISIILYGKNLLELSQIVDSTKFAFCNMRYKLLAIFKYILLNARKALKLNISDDVEDYSQINNYLKKLYIISSLINKMSSIGSSSVSLNTNDEKLYITELAKTVLFLMNELLLIPFRSNKNRKKIFNQMIDTSIIDLFVEVIIKYMSIETDFFKGKQTQNYKEALKEEEIKSQMIGNISAIVSEYMSQNEQERYKIIEKLTKAIVFSGVKIRKSFLVEIMENSCYSELRERINDSLEINSIFQARVYLIDYEESISGHHILLLSSDSIYFIEAPSSNYENDLKKDFEEFYEQKRSRVLLQNVKTMHVFDHSHRIILELDKGYVSLFFNRADICNMFKEYIKLINDNTKTEYRRLFRDEFYENKVNCKFVSCFIKVSGFFDFVTKMFKNDEVDTMKLMIIDNEKVTVLDEDIQLHNDLEMNSAVPLGLTDFKTCYEEEFTFQVADIKGLQVSNKNVIKLDVDGKEIDVWFNGDFNFQLFKKDIYIKRKMDYQISYN